MRLSFNKKAYRFGDLKARTEDYFLTKVPGNREDIINHVLLKMLLRGSYCEPHTKEAILNINLGIRRGVFYANPKPIYKQS